MTFTSSAALVGHLVAALAERRRALGVRQRELDDKAGFADGLCEKYEAGVRVPSVQALTWWADALGLKLAFNVCGHSLPDRMLQRGLALAHLSNGRSVSQTARMLGIPKQTVSYWLKRVQRLDTKEKPCPPSASPAPIGSPNATNGSASNGNAAPNAKPSAPTAARTPAPRPSPPARQRKRSAPSISASAQA